jgi:asparagine synthase (glutamine-hydrolysing)
MNAAMVHRGPDDDGAYNDPQGRLALGARRLSIIDVEGGHQPLSNEDGTVWAVLNGEIYNHPALRQRLLERGHHLSTRTDTEVLVHLYEDHGADLVHALEGMFAFAIWDERRGSLLLGRDRFGEKPLFIKRGPGYFGFASEVTALLAGLREDPELDPATVHAYFQLGYVPGPGTIVAGVEQLPIASTLRWSIGEPDEQPRRYWQPPLECERLPVSMDEIVADAELVLREAIRGRMLSDVPLGVFLSGGIDSTIVARLAAEESSTRLKTFSVGYDVGNVNETSRAREVAREVGADHREVVLGTESLSDRVVTVSAAIDQPLADPSLVATNALAESARKEVTVVVGGEGADEIFGGYPRYRWLARAALLGKVVPMPVASAVATTIRHGAPGRARKLAMVLEPRSALAAHVEWVTEGRAVASHEAYGPRLEAYRRRSGLPEVEAAYAGSAASVAGSFMRLDQEQWLPDDVLAKADRATMLASLELRTPYLHRELAELAALVPGADHVKSGGKTVLRRLLSERLGMSPPRKKTAFRVPASDWLAGPLQGLMSTQLRSGSIFEEGWFDRAGVGRLVAEHRAGTDRSSALWPILTLGLWLDAKRGRLEHD